MTAIPTLNATSAFQTLSGLLYAHKAGLDLEQYLAAIRNGAAGSKSLELYSGRILTGDMAPGFMVKVRSPSLGACSVWPAVCRTWSPRKRCR
jgi:3-hydroxyisobutyrate dehydrogenase